MGVGPPSVLLIGRLHCKSGAELRQSERVGLPESKSLSKPVGSEHVIVFPAQ